MVLIRGRKVPPRWRFLMTLSLAELLSPANVKAMDEKFHKDNAEHESRVLATSAKRRANNLARFGKPED
jgi:hypothetical protein